MFIDFYFRLLWLIIGWIYPPPRIPLANKGWYIGIPDPESHFGGDDCILGGGR